MRTKQVRPEKLKYEYELHVSKGYDRIKESDFLQFTLITTKIFRSFIYQINVTPKIDLDNKMIEFVIEGLSAPVISIAKSGNALYEYKLYGYKNTEYDLKLVKLDVDKNMFKMKITKAGIKLTKEPAKKFLKVEV
ncbi:MAG: hypothetical protein WCK13_07095 [Ignavibacteriota bacterium]|nr:hypothetical protein [Ignavibacteriota bacterium]